MVGHEDCNNGDRDLVQPKATPHGGTYMTTTDSPSPEQSRKSWQEELSATGDELMDRVKSLVNEGNVRRIIIKQDDRTLVELPLTIGVVGVLLAPQLAAIGAIAALVTRCTIAVEREDAGKYHNGSSSSGTTSSSSTASGTGSSGPSSSGI
jgi:hypothetical protein